MSFSQNMLSTALLPYRCALSLILIEMSVQPELELASEVAGHTLSHYDGYSTVRVLEFTVPEDSEVARFTFTGMKVVTSSFGFVNCPSYDIKIALKPYSLPVISPDDSSFPSDSNLEQRVPLFLLNMTSGTYKSILEILLPTPGIWFAVAYLPYKPKEASLKFNFMKKCDIVLNATLNILPLPRIRVLSLNTPFKETLQPSAENMYKMLIPRDAWSSTLHISGDEVQELSGSPVFSVRFRVRATPMLGHRDTHARDCYSTVCNLEFVPSPASWHYFAITNLHHKTLKYSITVTYTQESTVPKIPLYGPRSRDDQVATLTQDHFMGLIQQTSHDLIDDFTKYSQTISAIRRKLPIIFTIEWIQMQASDNGINKLLLPMGVTAVMGFDIHPISDVGGTLTLYMRFENFTETVDMISVMACLSFEVRVLPVFPGSCKDSYGVARGQHLAINTSSLHNRQARMHLFFPESGIWFLSFKSVCYNNITMRDVPCQNVTKVQFLYHIGSEACVAAGCGVYGECLTVLESSIVFSACDCLYGYRGWGCTDGSLAISSNEMLMSVLLLTFSNLAFIITAVAAYWRGYYIETVISVLTMLSSIIYHACDGQRNNLLTYCFYRYRVLQYADFFFAILTMWVTLIAVSGIQGLYKHTVLLFGCIGIAIGVEIDRLSIWVLTIPFLVGVGLIVVTMVRRYRATKKLYPPKRYWKCFFPPGAVLLLTGMILFAFVQTEENYAYVHSVWHVVVAISAAVLLPKKLTPVNIQSDSDSIPNPLELDEMNNANESH